MRTYNVVTNYKIVGEFKKSRYFKTNLGMSVTLEKNGERLLSDKDQFSVSYNFQYKTIIYAQGNIGNIKFYIDHAIKEDNIAFYYELEEFVFDYDLPFIRDKGIESYIGHLLKNVDDMYEERMNKNKEEKYIEEKTGVPENIINNPGAVSYADIKAYMMSKKIK